MNDWMNEWIKENNFEVKYESSVISFIKNGFVYKMASNFDVTSKWEVFLKIQFHNDSK